jgi:hypothetical protein
LFFLHCCALCRAYTHPQRRPHGLAAPHRNLSLELPHLSALYL